MKRSEAIKLKQGSIISATKNGLQKYYLTISRGKDKLNCFNEHDEGSKANDCIIVDVLGTEMAFDLKRKTSLAIKYVDAWITTIKETDKRKLKEILAKEIPFKEGDIIRFLSQIFIIKECKEKSYICRIYDPEKKKSGLQYTLFKEQNIEKIDSYTGKTFPNTEESCTQKEIRVGSLIMKKESMAIFYVYEESKEAFKAVKIDFTTEKTLLIDGISYHTSLKEKIEFPKQTKNYTTEAVAEEGELKRNSNLINPQKNRKQETNRKEKGVLEGGELIKASFRQKNYIVLLTKENSIICLDYDKYLQGNLFLYEFVNERIKITGKINRTAFREILEQLQNKYSSFLSKSEISAILSKEYK